MAIVRELITRFGFNVDKAGINNVERSIDKLSGLLSGLAAIASMKALIGLGDSMQSLEARIGMLPQTLGDVGAAFNEVSKHASAARMPILAYGSFYTKVGQAAKGLIKDQGDLLTVTDTISKALVVGGATTSEQSSALLQFGQALGSGVLQGDEFRSMAEAAPQYLDALAEALGHPREELKKMASDGKLTSKSVIEATLKMASVFDEKFRQMPMTVGAATTIIANKFGTMIAKLNRESLVITKIASMFLTGFDKIEAGFNKFVDYVGGSTNALKALGIALVAILGPAAFSGLLSILGAILSPAGLIIGLMVLIGLAIDDVITYLDGGQSAFGEFMAWMNNGSASASILQGVMLALASAFTVFGLAAARAWAIAGTAAVINAAKFALGWVAILGPMGLVYAGIAAVSAAIFALYNNWDKVKGFVSNIVGFGGGSTLSTPSTAATAATASKGNTTIDNRQEINVTVPQGTPEQQMQSIKEGAQKAYGDMQMQKAARDAQVYAP